MSHPKAKIQHQINMFSLVLLLPASYLIIHHSFSGVHIRDNHSFNFLIAPFKIYQGSRYDSKNLCSAIMSRS
ncbi:hypothetical protein AX774_g6373 [Zancudomyces culisetae]|uniref:Uncharacterized protein n=1 Tax=Zancudomyces culisetae TaxID=1213189 RepID=A0A1R1PGU0_ZANCU|nr:hypothetical protein AX774_g6373 [Zancudomyces culisetae]|eukprot:OMH80194.1 hypothetical protein AX774_g6373 [Zancudomyces culisetae]